jgi:hypothetical protein
MLFTLQVWMVTGKRCSRRTDRKPKYPFFYQYNETNVIHFSFVYWESRASACVKHYLLWDGCGFNATGPQPTDIKRKQYTKCSLCSASWGWTSNARNMQRPLILNKRIKSASCWFHYNDIRLLWCTVSKTLSNLCFTNSFVYLSGFQPAPDETWTTVLALIASLKIAPRVNKQSLTFFQDRYFVSFLF